MPNNKRDVPASPFHTHPQRNYSMKKIIEVTNCNNCPLQSECNAWEDMKKQLTKKEMLLITFGGVTPVEFILPNCHLEDAK